MLVQRALDILSPDDLRALPRCHDDQRILRIEPVVAQVRLDRVGVRRKHRIFHKHLVALLGRAEERNHHQVQVDGEAVHHHHLAEVRANQCGARLAKQFVVAIPRALPLEMGVHAELRPGVQLLVDDGARGLGLQTERVAREVDDLAAVVAFWNRELGSVGAQRIVPVARQCVRLVALVLVRRTVDVRHVRFTTEPARSQGSRSSAVSLPA